MPLSRDRSRTRALTVLCLAPVLALGGLLVTSPAQAQRIQPTFWGMHDSDWTTPPSVPVGAANFTTSGTYWPKVETSEGVYDFTRLDQHVEAAEARNARPMIVLGQSPEFHSTNPDSEHYADYMPDVVAWKAYVSAVAGNYGARLDYQIWPEPNIVQNWKGTPREMAKLTIEAAKVIEYHAPAAKVVSPALALRQRGQRRWMVKYFRQEFGGKRVHTYVDAIALDPFPDLEGSPEDAFALMRTARKQLADIGVRKPLWNNEINYGVVGAGQTTSADYSVNRQQAYVIRTYVLSAAAGMQRTYWLGWFGEDTMAIAMATADGNPLEPATSYEVVRRWLNRTRFLGCDQRRGGLWVCVAKQGRREVRRIYWDTRGRTRVTLPRSARRVENQENGVDKTPPRRIRVDFRPVMVASRR